MATDAVIVEGFDHGTPLVATVVAMEICDLPPRLNADVRYNSLVGKDRRCGLEIFERRACRRSLSIITTYESD